MDKQRFILWPDRPEIRAGAISMLRDAPTDIPVEVIIRQYRKSKTEEQCGYLFGFVYPVMRQHLEDAGHGRHSNDDMHDEMKKRFSPEKVTVYMRKTAHRKKELKEMNVKEGSEFIESILRYSATELGCYVPEADKNWKANKGRTEVPLLGS